MNQGAGDGAEQQMSHCFQKKTQVEGGLEHNVFPTLAKGRRLVPAKEQGQAAGTA